MQEIKAIIKGFGKVLRYPIRSTPTKISSIGLNVYKKDERAEVRSISELAVRFIFSEKKAQKYKNL